MLKTAISLKKAKQNRTVFTNIMKRTRLHSVSAIVGRPVNSMIETMTGISHNLSYVM
jgi:hypothetical protein